MTLAGALRGFGGLFRSTSSCASTPAVMAVMSAAELVHKVQDRKLFSSSSEEAAPSTSGSDRIAQPLGSKGLSSSSLGQYYQLDARLLPEAARSYAGAFYSPRDTGHERKGGCKALQQELEATGSYSVMYRPAMHALFEAVLSREHPRILLTGPAGSGKSIALVSLVEWARQQGWLAVYVPSASQLVRGGYFSKRRSNAGWDTLTSAQQLLKGLVDAHGAQLAQLAAPGGAGSLQDLAVRGLAAEDNAQLAVDSCLALVRQLVAAARQQGSPTRVLLAVDDYNSLYGTTEYGVLTSRPDRARRRVLRAEELVLARGLRVMEMELGEAEEAGQGSGAQGGGAQVVAALTASPVLTAPRELQPQLPYTEVPVPGFSQAEAAAALAHYHARGHAAQRATPRQVQALAALTRGNARELRRASGSLELLSQAL